VAAVGAQFGRKAGSCHRHPAECPMRVIGSSGRNSGGFSASCLSYAEPFHFLSNRYPFRREYSASTCVQGTFLAQAFGICPNTILRLS